MHASKMTIDDDLQFSAKAMTPLSVTLSHSAILTVDSDLQFSAKAMTPLSVTFLQRHKTATCNFQPRNDAVIRDLATVVVHVLDVVASV